MPPDPYPNRRARRPPDPVLVEGVNQYEIERILDSRIRYRRTEYLVTWRGYNDAHNQWIPWYNMDAEELVEEFHEQNPLALRQH